MNENERLQVNMRSMATQNSEYKYKVEDATGKIQFFEKQTNKLRD